MTNRVIDIENLGSEAAIYAEGTEYSKDDLIRLYREYISECEEAGTDPKPCQRFFSENLKIAE
jgi:hypothetical protein